MPQPSPGYAIDPATLREVLDDPDATLDRVHRLSAVGADGDAERVGWLRMLGRLDEAEALGRAVLAREVGGNAVDGPSADLHRGEPLSGRAIGAAVRLAHVLHWQGRFREADVLFDAARDGAVAAQGSVDESVRRYGAAMRAFVDQHQGKARWDENRFDEALVLLRAALSQRVAARAPADQVASSALAVDVVLRKVRGNSGS